MLSRNRVVALALLLAILTPSVHVVAQAETYPTVNIGYIELQLEPSDFSPLTTSFAPFRENEEIVTILAHNSTMFWTALGPVGENLEVNHSVSAFAIVQINNTGFYETLIALTTDNQTLEWVSPLSSETIANFSIVAEAATSFFSDDGHYWGLCEEFIVLPGSAMGQSLNHVWRLTFHLVAEGERWMLILDDNGNILTTQAWDIPCQSCPDPLPMLLGTSLVIAGSLAVLIVLFRRKD